MLEKIVPVACNSGGGTVYKSRERRKPWTVQ